MQEVILTNDDQTDSDSEDQTYSDSDKRINNHIFRWWAIAPPNADSEFQGDGFSIPPETLVEIDPYDYISKFWSVDITQLLVDQTNLYSTQLSGIPNNIYYL